MLIPFGKAPEEIDQVNGDVPFGVYGNSGKLLWQPSKYLHGYDSKSTIDCYLRVQDDGNLVLYTYPSSKSVGKAMWQSGTS